MPLFNLADIDFGTDRSGTNLDSQRFSSSLSEKRGKGYRISRYPIDIGNYDKGHYMLLHVNEQVQTSFGKTQIGGDSELPTVIKNELRTGLTRGQYSIGIGGGSIDINLQPGQTPILFRRPIRRISETIALYMPDTLAFDFNQSYSETPTTGGIAAFLAAGKSLLDGAKADGFKGAFTNLAPFLKAGGFELAKKYLDNQGLIGAAQQQILGFVQNPALEMLYSSPKMRSFNFEFMFYPRDEKEAKQVQEILNILRFHQAPEIMQGTGGFFLVPPSEFDIQFYYNGKTNPNIPPISTCVLESINVDYAPNGWSAYEKAGNYSSLQPRLGETGMPVAIRLRLQFRETEIVTKQFILATESEYDVTVSPPLPGGDGTELGR